VGLPPLQMTPPRMSSLHSCDADLVDRTLADYRKRVLAVMQRYIPDKEPRRYLYDLAKVYPSRPSKGLRPALCIASALAHGSTLSDALPTAASLELVHNAFLIHDDVEDRSQQRRGAATIQAEFGPSIAVNVGDAMNAMSIRPLADNCDLLGPTVAGEIMLEFESMVRHTVEGQAIELGWIRDRVSDLKPSDYFRMVLKKTCYYTCIYPLRTGAIVGTRRRLVHGFEYFGYYLGASFQIQDDLLNLIGDEAVYGKEIGGDLLEGKRTLMLIHLRSHARRGDRGVVDDYLVSDPLTRTSSDCRRILQLMEKYGSLDYARSSARALCGAAIREFHVAFGGQPESTAKEFIRNLIPYMVTRTV